MYRPNFPELYLTIEIDCIHGFMHGSVFCFFYKTFKFVVAITEIVIKTVFKSIYLNYLEHTKHVNQVLML